LFLAVLAGCEKPATEAFKPQRVPQQRPLLIGLIPEQQIFDQLDRYRPLVDYLSKRVGRKIELKVLSRYGNIIDNFVSAGLDGAFFGSFTYTLAHAKLGVEVLARPEGLDGRSTYHGLIFVRKDSGIRTAQDMKGKRFVFVDKATTAGYLLPLQYFSRNGIRNYKTYLKEAYFAGTHEDAIMDVMNRRADIGAAKNTIFEHVVKENPAAGKELFVLDKSPEVPENGLAVRKDLDPSLKEKLKEALLTMHDDREGIYILANFGARRFIETTDSDYEPVVRYARIAGLDLATYDYMND
ncbi:MAG TPA: phosphate/phosphite/phosphonate ABC transporter substrate-binding protein, partial [Thermodesulfovibrionales bacterium]|nr:phosphate/phosphite/phosphonate ABC transporter substrate-binding protein [Thermodesulfovibrionales bacterium]